MNKGRMLRLVVVLVTAAVVACARPDDHGDAEHSQPMGADVVAGEVAQADGAGPEARGEVVAARRIGAETVQHVANIAKYYVAYSRAAALGRTG